METKIRIRLRIKALRKTAGLSQAELADAIDRSTEAISLIERGRSLANIETLERVSRSLGVPIAELFGHFGDGRSLRGEEVAAQISAILMNFDDRDLETALNVLRALQKAEHR